MAPNVRTKEKVARALLAHAKSLDSWTRFTRVKRKLRPSTANRFLLGVMLDRSVKAEAAWAAAESIDLMLGDPEDKDPSVLWDALAGMKHSRLTGFLRFGRGGYAYHWRYKAFARLLPKAADHLLDQYGGDPRRIWNNQWDVASLRDRLEEIPTIGPALSRMAVLSLARNYGLIGGKRAQKQLDVKPDIHVRRVFARAGFTPPRASDESVIEAARALAPDFPAGLDGPSWDVGRRWCRPRNPACDECPIYSACPRIGLNA